MKIFLPIVPPKTTHHSKKIVRIGKFHKLADKPELTEVISDYMSLLQPYAPPSSPLRTNHSEPGICISLAKVGTEAEPHFRKDPDDIQTGQGQHGKDSQRCDDQAWLLDGRCTNL